MGFNSHALFSTEEDPRSCTMTIRMMMVSLLFLSIVLLNSVADAKHYMVETVDNNNNNNHLAETPDTREILRIPLTRGSRDYAGYGIPDGFHECRCSCCPIDSMKCCRALCFCKNE